MNMKYLYAQTKKSSQKKKIARKKTPKHGRTLVHKDKTKVVPRYYKYKHIEE